jgi:hypothetical protein
MSAGRRHEFDEKIIALLLETYFVEKDAESSILVIFSAG